MNPGGRRVGVGRVPAAGTQRPDRRVPRPLRGEMPLPCASAPGRTGGGLSRLGDSWEAGDAPSAARPHPAPAGSRAPTRVLAPSPPARALQGTRRVGTRSPVCRCTHMELCCSVQGAPRGARARSEPHRVPPPAHRRAALQSAAGRRAKTHPEPHWPRGAGPAARRGRAIAVGPSAGVFAPRTRFPRLHARGADTPRRTDVG